MPAVVYSNNFDGDSAGPLSDFTSLIGTWAVGTSGAVSSPNAFGNSSAADGDGVLLTRSGTSGVTDQDVSFSQIVSANQPGVALRSSSDAKIQYLVGYAISSNNIVVYKSAGSTAFGGYTSIGSAGGQPSFAIGSIVSCRCQAEGSTIRAKIWAHGAEEPDAWNVSVSDSSIPGPGAIGFRAGGPSLQPIDDLVFIDLDGVSVTTIAPDDEAWLDSPGAFDVTSSRARVVNPGNGRRIYVTGSSSATLTANVSSSAHQPQIVARWDSGVWSAPITVAASMALPVPPSTARHLLEIVLLNVGSNAEARWTDPVQVFDAVDLLLDDGAVVSLPPAAPVAIGFFGDSTKEGVAIVGDSNGGYGVDQDATKAVPFLLRSAVVGGAEVGVFGFGGQALTNETNTAGSGVPVGGTSFDLLYGGGPARDFSQFDLIVYGWGQNDGGASGFAADLEAIITSIAAANPAALHLVLQDYRNVTTAGEAAAAAAESVSFLGGLAALISSDAGSPSTLKSADSIDGNHPNVAATAVLLPVIAAAVNGLLFPTPYNWFVLEPGGGTIDARGNYTAPETAGTFHILAIERADPAQVGVSTVVVS